MSDRLPYEEQLSQQWNDLPLPDEDMAWTDMRRRLEEDDDDGIIPFWLRGCGLWGLLLIALVGIGWWVFWHPKNENKKEQVIPQQQTSSKKDQKGDSTKLLNNPVTERPKNDTSFTGKKNNVVSLVPEKASQENKVSTNHENEIPAKNITKAINKTRNQKPFLKQRISNAANRIKKEKKVQYKEDAGITSGYESNTESNKPEQIKNNGATAGIYKDPSTTATIEIAKPDSSRIISKDSTKKKATEQIVKNNVPKKDSSKMKWVSFSAGIAVHQLLPIDGQKLTPYNSQGRKGSFADYIPALFVRMYKSDKWFLQSEFRYGAPQYTREITYQQKGVLDTSGTTNTITSAKLKKTFYHQLPVSFNYFVLPNWSVGGGFVWNKFKGAVSEQDVVQRTVLTGVDTVITKGVILNSTKADSNFAKSYFQALVETQYQWKRFSLGARYSFGLQPYLKFTLPGGAQQNERNRSLQLFLRYEIWKSKAKSLKEKRR